MGWSLETVGGYPTNILQPTSSAGSGDMSSSVYDQDADGKVDVAAQADSVPYSGVSGKPSTFPPSTHTHDDRYYTETEADALLAGKVNTVSGKGLSSNDYTTSEKNKLALIEAGAQVNTVNSVAGKTGDIDLDKNDVGLGGVDNTPDVEKPVSAPQQAALDEKADLVDGKVPAAQLPSYVDDVLEYATSSEFPATGEAGKLYVDSTASLVYRWTGSTYAVTSSSLALGETSTTAYRGDRGKTAYDHSQATSNAHTIAAITGLQTALDGKEASGTAASAVSSHAGGTGVHTIAGVTGLQTALDGLDANVKERPSGNLLINTGGGYSSAKAWVDQAALTGTVSAGGYGPDQYKADVNYTYEEQADSSMLFSLTAAGTVQQPLESFKPLRGRALTFAVRLKSNVSGYLKINDGVTVGSQAFTANTVSYAPITTTLVVDSSCASLSVDIHLDGAGWVQILEPKLEVGSLATPWEPTQDLPLCQRYFRPAFIGTGIGNNDGTAIGCKVECTGMAYQPSISGSVTWTDMSGTVGPSAVWSSASGWTSNKDQLGLLSTGLSGVVYKQAYIPYIQSCWLSSRP